MDRRLLLFPAVVATAWAQQPATAPASDQSQESDVQKAIRARAEQFYQLEVEKKFRQADAFVAEDTKDYFFNMGKPDIKDAKVDTVELAPDGGSAKVYTSASVVLNAPGVGANTFTTRLESTWKTENGEWCWYVDQAGPIKTPFGLIQRGAASAPITMPSPETLSAHDLAKLVTIDRTEVDLTSGSGSVTISNGMPGPISLESSHGDGIKVVIDKKNLQPGEKAHVRLERSGDGGPNGAIRIFASPIGQEFTVTFK